MVEHKENDDRGLTFTIKLQIWTYLTKECCAVFEAVVDFSQRISQNLAEILIDVWVVH